MNKKYWHFVADDYELGYGDNRKVEPGATYTVSRPDDIELCTYGLHASKRLIDALKSAPGPVLCEVRLAGRILHGHDKAVASERTVIRMADITNILHEFACRCAEDALALAGNPDPRSIAAIRAKRDWLKGRIDDDELAAAGAAARAAGWETGAAAWEAAWAAARAAAWETGAAARVAAWAAGWEAGVAARVAGWEAGWEAGWVAAWAAARNKQNRRLVQMTRHSEWRM